MVLRCGECSTDPMAARFPERCNAYSRRIICGAALLAERKRKTERERSDRFQPTLSSMYLEIGRFAPILKPDRLHTGVGKSLLRHVN